MNKPNTSKPLPPPFPVGTTLRYRGLKHVRVSTKPNASMADREVWIDLIAPGIEVTICEVRPGRQGTGVHLRDEDGPMYDDEGEPVFDETSNGYSVYRVGSPVGRNRKAHGRVIRAEDAEDWETVAVGSQVP